MKFVDTQGTTEKGLARQKLEINPNHPIIQNIMPVKAINPAMAKLIVEQLFDNCLIAADMLDHPRSMLERLNNLLEKSSETARNSTPAVKEAEFSEKK